MGYLGKFIEWFEYPQLDLELKRELEEIVEDPVQIEERFYKGIIRDGSKLFRTY